MRFILTGLVVLASVPQNRSLQPDPPIACESCQEWNGPREPFKVFGNTYFVGTAGLSAILIAGNDGLVLIDGGLTQSAAVIDANIRNLGFRTEDVRLILNSHAHYDHAGGIAALQRLSRATVAAGGAGARALQRGEPTRDDPQFGFGKEANRFPAVLNAKRVGDGEVLRVGDVAVTAHLTPGHTPGSTAWTWRSCEATRCLNIVYADSLTPVAAPGFFFTGHGRQPSIVDSFRRSLTTVDELPCDVLLTPHPAASRLDEKLQRRAAQPDTDPFVDSNACRAYAGEARKALERRVADEKKSPR